MRSWKLDVAAISAVAVIALLGVAAVACSPSETAQASDPTPTPTPPAIQMPTLPKPPDKSPPQASPTRPAALPTPDERAASGSGNVYTWQDGDRTLRVVLQSGLVVLETAGIAPDDVVVVKRGADSIVRKQPGTVPAAAPVFRSESGGGLMTLPGGVLLARDPAWDEAAVESFFAQNDLGPGRVSALGYIQNGFLVETGPGFPSLELANALAAQDGVVTASPNWWTEVEAR